MEDSRKTAQQDNTTENRKLLQKTAIDDDGTVRRTAIGVDGTIYRTIIYPDGTVRKLKKNPTPESIAAAQEALKKLEEEAKGRKAARNSQPQESPGASASPQNGNSTPKSADGLKRAGDSSKKPGESRGKDRYDQGAAKYRRGNEMPVYENNQERRKDRKEKKKRKGLGFLLMLLVIVAVIGVFWFTVGQKYTPGVETADLNEYYGLTDDSQAIVIIDNELSEYQARIIDGHAYLDYETVQNVLNSRVYVDTSEQILLYSMPTYTISIPMDATSYDDNGSNKDMGQAVYTTIDDMPYVALDFVQNFTNMDSAVYTDPNRVVISLSEESVEVAKILKNCEVRELGGVKSPIMTQLEKGDQVTVLEVGDPWTKIATSDGLIGYVKDSRLSKHSDKDMTRSFEAPVYSNITRDHTIHMAWHQVTGEAGNATLAEYTAPTRGLNVIAPTWFFLTDTEGTVASIATADYVNQAHAMGLEVWAVANDFDGQAIYGGPASSDETFEILSHTSKRTRVEQSIITGALAAGVDGINIDYEKISEACGPHYIQFLRELSILCRNNGLVFSVDSYVPSAWTKQYHRDEQGEIADYVVIMAYDETGSWSEDKGSNSDLPYFTQAVSDILTMVDASKVIMGLPFYTRVWSEGSDETGAAFLNCETYSMRDQQEIINSHDTTMTWSDELGQYVATYESNGINYTIWVENTDSLKLKADVVWNNSLGGWSCWKLSQETPDVWDLLSQY